MKNTYKFRRHVEIGNLAAEDDSLLMDAFVLKDELNILREVSNNKCILLGRTGIGKSALIRFVEENEDLVSRVEPEAMSLRHISNSTIIKYFRALDVKLDLFYKVLWRHIFIVEFIKMRFEKESGKSSFLGWLQQKFQGDKRKETALKYLEKWEHHFWAKTEYRIKEIEQALEHRYSAELESNVEVYKAFKASGKIGNESLEKENIKSELVHKAQKVVNESQIEEISEIIRLMETDIFSKSQKKYFIIIDDLDKDWVDDAIVYDLVKALIEVINEFRKINPIKIIISLRSNIQRKTFHKNLSRGIQREKHSHLYLELSWSDNELRELLNKRLKELMRGIYTKDYPTVDDILPSATRRHEDGFSYIIERTLKRPRDVIDFFNKCIKYADGKTNISREVLRRAEDEYSHERLRALNDEWNENYGDLFVLYSFLKGYKENFNLKEVKEVMSDYFLEIVSKDDHHNLCADLKKDFEQYGRTFELDFLVKKVLKLLVDVSILGVKRSPEDSVVFPHEMYSQFQAEDIKEITKFYVHPMFHRALRIQHKSRLTSI